MDPDGLSKLTERERDCLRLVLTTDNQKEIARLLGIAPNTVYGHLKSAMRKLDVSSSVRAAQMLRDHEASPTPPQFGGDQPAPLPDPDPLPISTPSSTSGGGPHGEGSTGRPAHFVDWLRQLLRMPAERQTGRGNDLTIRQRLRDSVQAMLLAVFAIGAMASGLYGILHISLILTGHSLPR
ncbi:response regulator transcription factor [Sphingomonas sp. MMS24-J13]|uniref:response regulator transcription factor n=1 Tax=Sphingomonas sp. MMS24-J13 TaxID=3238686 RepID=UPI00384BA1CA